VAATRVFRFTFIWLCVFFLHLYFSRWERCPITCRIQKQDKETRL